MHDEYPDRYVTAAEALQMSDLEISQEALQLRKRADYVIRRACRYGNRDAKLRAAELDEWIGQAPPDSGGELHPVDELIAWLEADGFHVTCETGDVFSPFSCFYGPVATERVRVWLVISW